MSTTKTVIKTTTTPTSMTRLPAPPRLLSITALPPTLETPRAMGTPTGIRVATLTAATAAVRVATPTTPTRQREAAVATTRAIPAAVGMATPPTLTRQEAASIPAILPAIRMAITTATATAGVMAEAVTATNRSLKKSVLVHSAEWIRKDCRHLET
jgi:hypothetical protein